MPVFANPMSVLLLARAVEAQRHYEDLYEIRTQPLRFMLVNPCADAGVILAYLTEAEAIERLEHWPIRQPRHDQPRLPYAYVTEQGIAWLGRVLGAVP
jgi:hypothetical protein